MYRLERLITHFMCVPHIREIPVKKRLKRAQCRSIGTAPYLSCRHTYKKYRHRRVSLIDGSTGSLRCCS